MRWSYQYTPAIWPSIFTIVLITVLAIYAWRRRNLPGARLFVVYCLLGVFFLAPKVIEFLAVDFQTKVFWFSLEYPWWLPGTTALTCFVLEYAWPGRWVTRRTLVLLAIVPLLAVALLFTNDFHHLLFRTYDYNGDVIPLFGPAGWFFLAYNLGLRAVSIIALAWLFIRSPQHRLPASLIMIAETVVGVVLVLDPYIEESQFFYIPEKAIPVLACAIALFGYRIFDPIPLARQTVIEQLQAGMLVLDLKGCVVSLNPAAERILNAPTKKVKGKLVAELLPAYPEKCLADPVETEIKLGLEAGTSPRYYLVEDSLLKDFRGLEVGRLLLLRDVTEQKRAQAQILEQQKVQAVLEERAGLARELHDNIGQALATAQLRAETANMLIDRGEVTTAQDNLSRLVEVTQSAQVDIRQYLLGARTLLATGQDVFAALRQYIKQFNQDFGIPTELVIDPAMTEQMLDPRVMVQLIRVVQEGLANVRKHAHAASVQVIFALESDRIQVQVKDDGTGFDVAHFIKGEGPGFGLRSMRDRVKAVGGIFQIFSEPGLGTQVIAEVACGEANASLQWTDDGSPEGDDRRGSASDCKTPFHQVDYETPSG